MQYSTDQKALIALAEAEVPARRGYDIWEFFESGDDFFAEAQTSDFVRKKLGTLYDTAISKLTVAYVDEILVRMDNLGVRVTTMLDDDFPAVLRDMLCPPYLLYYRGDLSLCDTQGIAVVGTRKFTAYGEAVAKTFSKVLATRFTIVSGLAYGIDSIGHRTALDAGGKTIAVLGSGVANVYPSTNQALAERIVHEGGLLLSEYGIDSVPQTFHFPDRNRIVAALSQGVLVCEAPVKSGTLLTARNARDEGRDVFAVPGDIFLKSLKGGNELIKGGEAICVTCPEDILDYYGETVESAQKAVQLDFSEQAVVDELQKGQCTFDQLVQTTHILPGELNFLLANLEIKSIISKLPGNAYRLIGGTK